MVALLQSEGGGVREREEANGGVVVSVAVEGVKQHFIAALCLGITHL